MKRNSSFILPALISLVASLPVVAATAKIANESVLQLKVEIPPTMSGSYELDGKGVQILEGGGTGFQIITLYPGSKLKMEISGSLSTDIMFILTETEGVGFTFKYPRLKNKWEVAGKSAYASVDATIGFGDKITLK